MGVFSVWIKFKRFGHNLKIIAKVVKFFFGKLQIKYEVIKSRKDIKMFNELNHQKVIKFKHKNWFGQKKDNLFKKIL